MANYSQFVICLWFICILKAFNNGDVDIADVINLASCLPFGSCRQCLLPLAIPFPSPIPFRFFRFLYFILYFLYSYLNTICNTYKRHSISTWSPNKGHSHWDFPHGMLSICHRRLWWAQSSAPSVSSSLICRPENVSALIKFCTDFQVDKRPYSCGSVRLFSFFFSFFSKFVEIFYVLQFKIYCCLLGVLCDLCGYYKFYSANNT